jgi:hypothetical protein
MIFWLSSGKIDALTRPSIIILLAMRMLSGSLLPFVIPDEVNFYRRCHRPQALGYALCDGDTGPMTFHVSVELPMTFDVVDQRIEIGQLTPYNQRLAQNGRSSPYSLLAGAAAGGAGSAGGGVVGGGGGAGAGAAWGCDSALRSKAFTGLNKQRRSGCIDGVG